MTTLEILRAARELLSDPTRWCKAAMARTEEGIKVEPDDPRACRWCSYGAIRKVCGELRSIDTEELISGVCQLRTGGYGFVTFNDRSGTSHKDVMDLFDAAIARAEQLTAA